MRRSISYRVRNWGKYNKALVRRGDIQLWISDDVLAAWHASKREGFDTIADKGGRAVIDVKEGQPWHVRRVVACGSGTGSGVRLGQVGAKRGGGRGVVIIAAV